jgi:GT2 family glycosyltransferase
MTQLPDGLSVLIPERGRPDLLAHTLEHLRAARQQLDAASETTVLVNGSSPTEYVALQRRFQEVQFVFERKALGYGAAMERLVESACHAWVYLLNSDMVLDRDALSQVWRWRDARVFAVASQIFFADKNRRREETGWCVPVVNDKAKIELHDRLPMPDQQVRASLYAGGGSSLMQTRFLQSFMKNTRAYAPFYFEDADWGMQAWATGLDVLFCPQSIAIHHHRATISRYYSAPQIARIVERNLSLWRLRYADRFRSASRKRTAFDRTISAVNWLRPATQRVRTLLQSQANSAPDWASISDKRYLHAPMWRAGKLRALVVSPFSVLPPTHGGARRILELCRATAHAVDWTLLSDEGVGAQALAKEDVSVFRQWHSVRGRPPDGANAMTRLEAHAHAGFQSELRRLLVNCAPQVVCLEHYESLGLLDAIPHTVPVVLSLHDGGARLPSDVKHWVRQRVMRAKALVVPGVLDLAEFAQSGGHMVPNGVRVVPGMGASPPDGMVLLVAPLRYEANQRAVVDFLKMCWPKISSAAPLLRLRILAGENGEPYWQMLHLQDNPRIEVVTEFSDPSAHYQACSMAINPQTDIEGSSLKLLEALGHGRMVISTQDGARGFDALETSALVRVGSVADMVEPILRYWTDLGARRRAEAAGPAAVQPWCWEVVGEKWLGLLKECVS